MINAWKLEFIVFENAFSHFVGKILQNLIICAINHHIKSTWCYNYGAVCVNHTAGWYMLLWKISLLKIFIEHSLHFLLVHISSFRWAVMIWDSMMLRSKLVGIIIILILIVSRSILASNTHNILHFLGISNKLSSLQLDGVNSSTKKTSAKNKKSKKFWL